MEIYTDVRGRAGIDCGGFCEFCFYKNVNFNDLKSIGCINCPPNQIGCPYCQNFVKRVSSDFKPIYQVLPELREKFYNLDWRFSEPLKMSRLSLLEGADIFSYPQLYELVSILKESPVSAAFRLYEW